ncbi:MAG: hypothetical protein ACO3EZ_03050 [Prochlorotrichaceae cyanobacterium]
MADGDIVHRGLRRLYHKPYKWLCEGACTSDECARLMLETLKKDLQAKGDLPIVLSQAMADRLEGTISNPQVARESDFIKLSIEFDALAQEADGSPFLKELALRAGKSFLHDLRNGLGVDISHALEAILAKYMHEVYESEFKERIPLNLEHHAGVTQATLENRIEAIQPNIESGIQKFARNAMRNQTVARLSLPRRFSRKSIDLDEDLLAG